MTEEEFNLKYQLYAQEVYTICYGYTRNPESAEDLLQDIFLKYLNKNISFQSLEHEKYWLLRVSVNTCKNYVKSFYKKNVSVQSEWILSYPDHPKNKETEVLSFCIRHLPEKYKEIIILFYFNSYKTMEIAQILHISLAAVKKRLERARQILKTEMEKYI